jgi:hypothetical protein
MLLISPMGGIRNHRWAKLESKRLSNTAARTSNMLVTKLLKLACKNLCYLLNIWHTINTNDALTFLCVFRINKRVFKNSGPQQTENVLQWKLSVTQMHQSFTEYCCQCHCIFPRVSTRGQRLFAEISQWAKVGTKAKFGAFPLLMWSPNRKLCSSQVPLKKSHSIREF